MSHFGTRRLLGLLLLLLLNLALGALAWEQYRTPLGTPPDSAARLAGEDGGEQALPGPSELMLAGFPETLARPLFNPERRPPEPEKPARPEKPAPAVDSRPQVQLVGVVITPESREALLRWRGQSKLLRIAQHEAVEGWELTRVDDQRITLKKNDEVIDARLERKRDANSSAGNTAAKRRSSLYIPR